jgi:HEAT repeat protein
VSDLRSKDLTERVAAIAALHARGTATPTEIDDLVACLGDEYKAVQRRAADALAAVHGDGVTVTDRVRAALAATTLRHRWGAAYALSRLGVLDATALPVLVEVLGSDDGDRRWAAAQMIVGLASDSVVIVALRGLLAAPNPMARKMALYCLRDLGRSWAGSDAVLVAALADSDPAVRLAALNAAPVLAVDREAMAAACARLLGDVDAGVSRAAAPTLAKLKVGSASVRAALQMAADGDDPARARAARAALSQLGP